MIQKTLFFILFLAGLISCSGNREMAAGKSVLKEYPKQSVNQTQAPFKQINLTPTGEDIPEKYIYGNLRFEINDNKTNFLTISDTGFEKAFSLDEVFGGIGLSLRLFDNREVQLLSMELEYEYSISTHLFLIQPGNIHELTVADFEIASDDFKGLKYEVTNVPNGAVVKIINGKETREIQIPY